MSRTGGTTTSVSSTKPPEFQMPFLQQSFDEAQRLYEAPGPGFFPGSTVAGFTPAEKEGQQSLMEFARTFQDKLGPVQGAFDWALTDARNVGENPYAAAAVEGAARPMWQGLTEQALPAIRAGAGAGGTMGSSRQALAEAQAIERTSRAVGDMSSNMYSDMYGQGLNTMLSALGMAPTITGLGAVPGTTMAGVGAQEREMEQARLNEDVARHQYEQNLPFVKLAEFANMIRGPFGGQGESTVTEPELGLPEAIFGGGMTLLPLIQQIIGLFGGN